MRKSFLILLGSTFLLTGMLHAKALEIVKEVNTITVKISLAEDPPKKGKNEINITLIDADRKEITNSKVDVYYFMKPKKGMQPMLYKAKAKFDEGHYKATVDFLMQGTWIIEIKFKGSDKGRQKVKVQIKVIK